MKYKKIYVISVSDIATGGPENLHQLVDELRNNGQDASIVYFPRLNADIPEPYKHYNVVKSENIDDSPHNAIVIPEHFAEYCFLFKRANVFLWWLSYDYYFGDLTRPSDQKIFRAKRAFLLLRMKFSAINHLFQSNYAMNKLTKFGIRGRLLSDYLNEDFLVIDGQNNKIRRNNIIFNPTKGQYYNSIMVEAMSDIECTPITGLSRYQVIELMKNSSYYVDLGEHPGKDRMPREAALCGCNVIVANRGAATCYYDMPIDQIFKINLTDNFIKSLRSTIAYVKNSNNPYDLQEKYRQWILKDRSVFKSQVHEIFS